MGRYGGEQILMVRPGISRLDAENRMLHIQQAVSAIAHSWHGDPFWVTLSIGLVWVSRETVTAEGVIRRADHALYAAKSEGRCRVVIEVIAA